MTAPAPLGRNVINNHIAKRAPSRHDTTSPAGDDDANEEILTIPEAKWRLARSLGVAPSNIKIIIEA
jgi:hypothetical protein